jgi:MoaA/NifB/PqqE/SkfB family radical SAM enzyme
MLHGDRALEGLSGRMRRTLEAAIAVQRSGRRGALEEKMRDVLGNLRSASKMKEEYGVRLGIAVVLMKWNYGLLPQITRMAGELGLDFLARA